MNINEYLGRVVNAVVNSHRQIDTVIDVINGRKEDIIFTCGNGGSGANASHFTQDLVKAVGIYSICLNDNVGLITAFSNDVAFDVAFSKQLDTFPLSGNLLFCISGSGESSNIINACKVAKYNHNLTIALVGFDGGTLKNLADYAIHVKSNDMRIVESAHSIILHYIIDRLEAEKNV